MAKSKQRNVHDIICELEEPIYDIRDLARAIHLVAEGLDDRCKKSVLNTIAGHIERLAELVQDGRGELFHLLRPSNVVPLKGVATACHRPDRH
jgi:hypothetical protein